jgi:hypothetical protein
MGAMELVLLLSVLVPVGLVVGIPVYFVRRHLRLREREVAALEAQRPGGKPALALEEENRALRDRVEKLEAIVTSTDFELDRKLAALEAPSDPKSR